MRSSLFICSIFLLFLFSCRTQREPIQNYLDKAKDSTATNVVNIPDAVVQKNDLLSIKVYSLSADPRVDAMYNLPEQTVAGSSTTSATAGFLVDNDGSIEYPRLGRIQVEGLTKNEVARIIKEKLDTILKSPSVIVRFLNYRVTVLGEVKSPGSFNVPTERVTIFEALGLAGDVTEFGNKRTVKIKRENNGQVAIQSIDLTVKDIFTSPYYHLQQNDVVFVEQTGRKLRLQEQQNVVTTIGIITGIVTTIALIINLTRF